MRSPIRLASAALALMAVACTPAAKTDAVKDEFKRDLALASATTMDLATPAVNTALLKFENASPAPEPAKSIRKAETGDHAIRSENPTVAAEPEAETAPLEEAAPPATTVAPAPAPVATATAPAPVESDEPVAAAPRSQPARTASTGSTGEYGRGGGVFGGGIGVVIRGGGVGGDDHCQIRPRGGVIYTSPIYMPRPLGTGITTPRTATRVVVRPGTR